MDESPAEAMHSGNSNAVENKKITPSEYLQKLIDEKKNSTSSLHAGPMIKRNENISLSPAEERHAHDPIACPSFLRRKVGQEEIALKREYKKMEQVWTNRGLPVDRETVCSAARKDAFDLKDLSESLPSTSASVNKQKYNGIFTRWRELPIEALLSLQQRFSGTRERLEQTRLKRVLRSSASERIPSASERIPSAFERIPSAFERIPSAFEKIPSASYSVIDEKENSTSSLHADPLIKRNENIFSLPAEETHAHDPIPSPSFLRRKVRQEEIALKREYKKMEQVWTNRGLPVNRETVCSAASKDAFDLKDLSESLPSTYDSRYEENFKTFIRLKEMATKASSSLRQRLPRIRQVHELIRRERASRSSVSERIPSASNSVRETIERPLADNPRLALQVRGDIKREHMLQTWDDSLTPRSSSSLKSLEQSYFGSKYAQMSIDYEQDEKDKERQNSDAENHLPRPGLNVLPPPMTNDVSKLATKMEQSGWDTEKKRTMKFHFPGVLVPHNSPVKKEENADMNDLFLSRKRMRVDSRLKALRRLREQNKLKYLDDCRKVSYKDRCESDEPSLEEVSKFCKQHDILIDNLKQYRNVVRRMKMMRNFRLFQSPIFCQAVKSTKVIPD